jgi:hypothetical protein
MVRLVRCRAGREEGDAACHAALGQRLQGRGGGGDGRRDAGDDFDLDAGFLERAEFLVGAAEQHRIAALQAHDALVVPRGVDEFVIDDGLRRRALAGALADRDQLGLRAQGQHLRGDEGVVQHHLRLPEQARPANGNEISSAGTGSNQINFSQRRHGSLSFVCYASIRIIPAATV